MNIIRKIVHFREDFWKSITKKKLIIAKKCFFTLVVHKDVKDCEGIEGGKEIQYVLVKILCWTWVF